LGRSLTSRGSRSGLKRCSILAPILVCSIKANIAVTIPSAKNPPFHAHRPIPRH